MSYKSCFGDPNEWDPESYDCEQCAWEGKCKETVRLKERDVDRYGYRSGRSRPVSRTMPVKKPRSGDAFGPSIHDNRVVYLKTLERKPGESLWSHAARSAMLMGIAEGLHEAAVQVRYSRFAGAYAQEEVIDSEEE